MTDPITIERSELRNMIIVITQEVLQELGVKMKDVKPYISQRQAHKLIGRSQYEKALTLGLIRVTKKNPDQKTGRVEVNRRDVEKLIAKPIL